jgi:thymidylate synthase
MNNIDIQYQDLLKDILTNGTEKSDRTGTGTISIFGRQIRHKMSEGFPLLTTKKMAVKSMMTELKWFLKGGTNIKYLVENGCNIWNGDAYKNYVNKVDVKALSEEFGIPAVHHTIGEFIERIKTSEDFAKDWGELGPIYGLQWRDWYAGGHQEFIADTLVNMEYSSVDQISELIKTLKNNPDSRRMMVNAWNVGELDQMVLPPCHYGFQVYTRELSLNDRILEFAKRDLDPSEFRRGGNYGTVIPAEKTLEVLNKHNIPTRAISLMWNQRSVDTPLGLPFNIASYATLLLLLAEEVNMVPDELIGNLGDVHIYKNQVDGVNEQLGRMSYDLPTLKVSNVDILNGEFDYELEGYEYHPTIKFPLSN